VEQHATATSTADPPAATADHNEVRLRGAITSAPERRTLPSGDEVVAVRVTVRRQQGGADTVRISVGPAPPAGRRPKAGQVGRRLLSTVGSLSVGAHIEVRGQLRRRWWDAGGARRSLVEVVADEVHAVSDAPA
jgi:single-strand DNA-binding protein